MKHYIPVAAMAAILSLPAAALAEQNLSPGQQSSGQINWDKSSEDAQSPGSQSMAQPPASEQSAQIQMTSETVRQVQQALQGEGYSPGMVDGIWGQQTASALRNFQQANGLQPTGQPDMQSLQQLGVTPGGAMQSPEASDSMNQEPAAPGTDLSPMSPSGTM